MNDAVKRATDHMVEARVRLKWKPETYKKGGTGQQNVLCGAVYDSGRTDEKQYPCHKPINYFTNSKIVWSCYGYRTSKDIGLKYFAWLVNLSPWSKTGIIPTYERSFQFNQGFVFEGLDKTPANLFHNFLVASRMACEWPKFIEAWHELVTEHGVNPDLAFVFLTVFRPVMGEGDECCFNSKIESVPAIIDRYDWPLDMARADETYVKNFLGGKPVGLSKIMFWPTALTTPVNTVWGKLLSHDNSETYANFLKKTYEKDYTLSRKSPKIRSILGRYDDGNHDGVFTPESLLEVIKLEEKRLGVK